ncbi:DUF58 domain-containing protein [Aliikangiella coralliicola]|uniref:DUF58 domain-containing protein n=1 Tax=Aliikangiella coralliicola TaxID=2592383 RepID=A0A545U0F8_9GAMM|nr:DUF58 domain-containing protein [Aliikangiella coralliicola]TQV82952.1 DUF58 domain-containing protein [Aliikangiella coralliicola]
MKIPKSIKNSVGRWFGSRMPVGDSVTLNQRSSYIWPTRAGYLLLGIVILMMIGATNYQNNLAFLLTFLLIGIGLVTIVYTFKNMQGIQFSVLPVNEAFVGQPLAISMSLTSNSGKEHYSIGIGQNNNELLVCDVPDTGNATATINFEASRRGHFELPRLMVTSEFPFGWLKTWAYFRFVTPILIYPKPIEPPQLYEQDHGKDSDEGVKSEGNEDFYGLKSYQPGESLSRIDWKAYAREKGMFVREFVAYKGQQLCFNWQDFPGNDDEVRLSYLTFMVLQAASQNLTYTLIFPGTHIGPGDGEEHRAQCLEALALYGEKVAPS